MDSKQTTKTELNRETAKIPWTELERFFASGNAIFVAPSLDLIDVALACRTDDAKSIQSWMDGELVYAVKDEQAQSWLDKDSSVWAVVVAPWVLIQDVT